MLGLSDALNTAGFMNRVYSNQYMKANLEHALHSLMRANELQPNDAEIKHDLNYVTSLYQAQQHRQQTQQQADETTTNMLR